MGIVKAVVENIGNNGNITSRRAERLLKADVHRHGSRRVDEGTFEFPMYTDIDEGSHVKYIQDIVNTDLLVLLHNFQMNVKDESGWDINPTDELPDNRFIQLANVTGQNRFRGNYGLHFNSSEEQHFDLPENDRIDMSGQFDIFIWCQRGTAVTPVGEENYIWSCSNSNTHGYIEIGLHTNTFFDRVLAVNINNGSTTTVHTGTINSVQSNRFLGLRPALLRIKRDENNDIKCYFNGDLQFTISDEDADFGSRIRYGAHYHPHTIIQKWDGYILQDRLYCGGYLTEKEANTILVASPQQLTMKFSGVVWRLTDDTFKKMVQCKGVAKSWVEAHLTPEILSGSITTPVSRTENVYDGAQSNHGIIKDMIETADSTFNVKTIRSDEQYAGKFVATGSIIPNIELQLLRSEDVLFSTPLKTIILENEDGIDTDYEFVQNDSTNNTGYIIRENGKDDITLINDLELVGRIDIKHGERGLGSRVGEDVVTLPQRPLQVTVVAGTHVGTPDRDYTVDYDAKQITFAAENILPWSTTDTVTVKYEYEDTDSNVALFVKRDNSNSIRKNGRYSKKLVTLQFTNKNDMRYVAGKIVNNLGDVKNRYQIEVHHHVNHIRENMRVHVANSIKNIDETAIVRSINWQYPKMRTTIQVGEHRFDAFDFEKQRTQDLQSQVIGTTKTQNA